MVFKGLMGFTNCGVCEEVGYAKRWDTMINMQTYTPGKRCGCSLDNSDQ